MSEPTNPAADRDTVGIIGAGIVGLACALRLAGAGRPVIVFDREAPGHGCSRGNAGVLATDTVEPLASPATLRAAAAHLLRRGGPLAILPRYALPALPWLLRFAVASRRASFERGCAALTSLQAGSLASFRCLLHDAGGDRLLRAKGHLLVTEHAAGQAALLARRDRLAQLGVAAQWLHRRAVTELAPGLADTVRGALHFPETAHVVDPYRVCRRFARAVEQYGGQVLREEVRRIDTRSDGAFELHTGSGQRRVGQLVVAAGAWSRPLARQLGERLPLDTERGYQVTTSGWHPDIGLPVESLERHTFMTPMETGLRITGYSELGGLALPPVGARFDALRRHLEALVPGIELGKTTEWMGHRPSLPDLLPVIGRCRRHPRAVIACGHQHLGLTLSGITADIVADLLADRQPAVDIAPFRCDRFA